MKKVDDYEIARFSGVMRYPTEKEKESSGASGEQDEKVEHEGEERRMLLYSHTAATATATATATTDDDDDDVEVHVIQGEENGENGENGEKGTRVEGGEENGEENGEEDGMWIGVGELKLSDLRGRLQRMGLRAEFQQGGVLVCEGDVSIFKDGPNHFKLEGVVGERYYKIREVLYQVLTYVP